MWSTGPIVNLVPETGGRCAGDQVLVAGFGQGLTHPDDLLFEVVLDGVGVRSRKIAAVIPQKSDEIAARQRRGSAGGRPPSFDEIRYQQRNLVERSFALLKQWRGLATRYDKLAIVYRAAVVLSACITWTRHMADMP